jgi:outer membrane protein assembly factor BamB
MFKTRVTAFIALLLIGGMAAVGEAKAQDQNTAPWRVDVAQVEWDRLTNTGDLLVSSSNGLSCFDGQTGQQLWTRKEFAEVPSAGVWDLRSGPYLMINPSEGKRRRKKDPVPIKEVIDIRTGETVFTLEGVQGNLRALVPLAGHNIAVALTEVKVKDKEASGIYGTALSLPDGKQLWRTKYGDRRAKIGASVQAYPVPTVRGDTLFLSYLGTHALDLSSGAIRWGEAHSPVDGRLRKAYAAPVVSDGVAYYATNKLFKAVEADTGALRWSAKLRSSPAVSEIRITSNRVIARLGGTFTDGGKLRGSSPIGVVAYDKITGRQVWFYPDAEETITDMVIDEKDDLVAFADGVMIIGVRLSTGAPLFESAIQYFRLYGIFEEGSGGFAISGGYSKTGPGGTSGGGGLGMFSSGMDLEDLPLDSDRLEHDVIIRGQHHILAYDPELRIIQWSSLFGDAEIDDPEVLRTGLLPGWSGKGRAYFLTIMEEGKGRRSREILSLFGVDPLTSRIVSRLDIPGKKPRFHLDAVRDRIILISYERKQKRTTYQGYGL